MQLLLTFAPALVSTRISQSTVERLSTRKVVAMEITRQSILTGIIRTREIDVTVEQVESWKMGALIQDAMPHLSVSDREFVVNGITDAEWHQAFGEEDED
tara:strand:+ start:448 stop:747 length:300 start_codon:yes stop_codon:yes gene_type:complete